ncbi:MAG: hypothetical protein HXX09_07415 [Bacteroidetes bacterium]|nr:hypothetical protein [Bacteroidota bacterium]
MKKLYTILSFAFILFSINERTNAQSVGISNVAITPDPSSILELRATNMGLLIPRVALTMTTSNAPIGAAVATSLLVFNTAAVGDVSPGFYYWGGSSWKRIFATNSGDAWQLLGNSATISGTNFIGTTDAIDLVTKTNNLERTRILSGGNILFNRSTALFATDLFEAQGNATFPDAINGFTDQAAGNAVFGQNSAANGTSIFGYNSALTGIGTGAGVYGMTLQTGSAGTVGDGSTVTRGLLGITNSALYAATQTQNLNADGDALYAVNSAANGALTGTAIYASSGQTGGATIIAGLQSLSYYSNSAISAYNASTLNTSKGVIGAVSQIDGIGVFGNNSAAASTGQGNGLYGQTFQSNGIGAEGFNRNTIGTGVLGTGNNATGSYLTNGSGGAFTGTGTGSYSFATTVGSGTGVIGVGNNIATAITSVNGSGGAFTGSTFGVVAYKSGGYTNNTGGGLFIANSTTSSGVAVGYRTGGTNYKVIDMGAFGGLVSTDVWGLNGDKDRKIMFCPESPEVLFQDFGTGILVNGTAKIVLDPIFSKNIVVNEKHPLRVYVQLEGNCNGVYVTNKTQEGFEVIELNNGNSNVQFSWFISANRADYINPVTNELISKNEGVRFPSAPDSPGVILNQSSQTKKEKLIDKPINKQQKLVDQTEISKNRGK